MRTKGEITIIFGIILVMTLVLVAFNFTSSETKVCLNPIEEVYLHQTFTINVDIADVRALQYYSVMIYYQTIPIDAVSVEWPPGHFLEPLKHVGIHDLQQDFRIIRKGIDDNFNTTHGRVWISASFSSLLVVHRANCKMGDIKSYYEAGRTGSGTLFTITFNCTGRGTSVLCLYQTELSGKDSSSIPHSQIHGLIRAH